MSLQRVDASLRRFFGNSVEWAAPRSNRWVVAAVAPMCKALVLAGQSVACSYDVFTKLIAHE